MASVRLSIPHVTSIFLEADPLIALTTLLARRPDVAAIAFSSITIAITLLFGRVFCGYVCPLGTIVDLTAFLAKIFRIEQKRFKGLEFLPIVLVAAILVLTAFKTGAAMIVDPISLTTRAAAVVVTPAKAATQKRATAQFGLENERRFRGNLTRGAEGTTTTILPNFLNSSAWILGIFAFVILLNFVGKRFWCRYLCPLGGLLGLIGRVPFYRRKVDQGACLSCTKCAKRCDMQAINHDGLATDPSTCTLCMECVGACPVNAISVGLKPELSTEIPSRRTAIAAIGGSIAVAVINPFKGRTKTPAQTLFRPPGVSNEEHFLNKCVRCGECLAACPTKALQPALLQFGVSSLWTPHVDFSNGPCLYECNACGQVCPTGAIEHLTLEKKQQFAIGTAQVNMAKCLQCGICVEVCPVSGTISGSGFGDLEVNSELCIGCGICEIACPVRGEKAIRVFRSELGPTASA